MDKFVVTSHKFKKAVAKSLSINVSSLRAIEIASIQKVIYIYSENPVKYTDPQGYKTLIRWDCKGIVISSQEELDYKVQELIKENELVNDFDVRREQLGFKLNLLGF